jgi:hypothetical protein
MKLEELEQEENSISKPEKRVEAVTTFKHWETQKEQLENIENISNYYAKHRFVEKIGLMTQKEVLEKYHEHINREDKERIHFEIASEKSEIFNEKTFLKNAPESAAGFRTPDGKIVIRDSENMNQLEHVATHEMMHDLSAQRSNHDVEFHESENEIKMKSKVLEQVGIRQHIIEETFVNDEKVEHLEEYKHRSLNEGITEMFTIDILAQRGKHPELPAYSTNVKWARSLRFVVGDDVIAKSYFGGDVELLKSSIDQYLHEGAFNELSYKMDRALSMNTPSKVSQLYIEDVNKVLTQLEKKALERNG